MGKDLRRLPLITGRITKNMTLRKVGEEVSKRIGRYVSHVTIWNLERDFRVNSHDDIKQALCDLYGLSEFPADPSPKDERAVVP